MKPGRIKKLLGFLIIKRRKLPTSLNKRFSSKMTNIKDIISSIAHRPFPIPKGSWRYYQEWNNALFLHWKIPIEILRNLVPRKLKIDSFDDTYYISLVAFTMEKIRPKFMPSISIISNFHEINLRTYIENNGKKGVYFLNIEAEKLLSTLIAKSLSRLPYEKSKITRTHKTYTSKNKNKGLFLDTEFEVGQPITQKTELDKWLTERYCLYLDINKKLYRYDIHHKEWELKTLEIRNLKLKYQTEELNLTEQPNLHHYSDGIKVLAWKRAKI